jgi:hypothetical protein
MKDLSKLLGGLCEEGQIKDYEEIGLIIELFTPKIKKSILQTSMVEREDLEQMIKMGLFEKIKNYDQGHIPGFFEFTNSLNKTG